MYQPQEYKKGEISQLYYRSEVSAFTNEKNIFTCNLKDRNVTKKL
jgi:hypothetical protein